MPKYRINCSTSTSYTLLVEAPSREAAGLFYQDCDAGVFHRCADDLDWNLDDIHVDDTTEQVDTQVDSDGHEIVPQQRGV